MSNTGSNKAAKISPEKRKLITILVSVVVGLLIFGSLFGFLIWPKLIKPNMTTDVLYTPEIVQTYCTSSIIVNITDCAEDGSVSAVCEIIGDGTYSKFDLKGKITEKKNNGDLVIEWTNKLHDVTTDTTSVYLSDTVEIKNGWADLVFGSYTLAAGENDSYLIDDAADLEKLVNSNGLFILKCDIDLGGMKWTPIEGFGGTLLGNGYSIKNMYLESADNNVGFFSTLTGVVNNVKFENATVKVSGGAENVGIVCGTLDSGNIFNVTVRGNINADSAVSVGGIAGKFKSSSTHSLKNIKNLAMVSGKEKVGGIFGSADLFRSFDSPTSTLSGFENVGLIKADGSYVGGIIGYFKADSDYTSFPLYATEFKNMGNVIGESYVGGLFGYAYSNSSKSYIQTSSNAASISAEHTVGGLAGALEYITVSNCKNENSTIEATKYEIVDGVKHAYVGGFVGKGYLISDCTNTISINYTGGGRYVGGIAGYVNFGEAHLMSKLKNVAKISGADFVGGIFGCIDSFRNFDSPKSELREFENSGAIVADGNYAGGIIGYYKADSDYSPFTLYALEFKNTADVVGKAYVGGLFGYGFSNSTSSYIEDSSSCAKITAEYMIGGLAGCLENIAINSCDNMGSEIFASSYTLESGNQYAYVGGYVGKGFIASDCINTVNINYESDGRYVGGIIGYSVANGICDLSNLKNTGAISGANYVGGIFGYAKANNKYSMDSLINEGTVFGGDYVGGVIGCMYSFKDFDSPSATLSGFENSAEVRADGNYVGGIFGYYESDSDYNAFPLYVLDFSNTSNVSGKDYVGGLFGYVITNTDNSYIQDSENTGTVSGTGNTGELTGYIEKVTVY